MVVLLLQKRQLKVWGLLSTGQWTGLNVQDEPYEFAFYRSKIVDCCQCHMIRWVSQAYSDQRSQIQETMQYNSVYICSSWKARKGERVIQKTHKRLLGICFSVWMLVTRTCPSVKNPWSCHSWHSSRDLIQCTETFRRENRVWSWRVASRLESGINLPEPPNNNNNHKRGTLTGERWPNAEWSVSLRRGNYRPARNHRKPRAHRKTSY